MRTSHIICISLLLTILIIAFLFRKQPISIDGIWVINLEKDIERFNAIRKSTEPIRHLVHRWSATYGKDEPIQSALAEGVALMVSGHKYEKGYNPQGKVHQNPGAVGCWLSHKRLLRHLSTLNVADSTGHLIVEDDIHITPDFLTEWNERRHTVPADWDIVFFDINKSQGVPVTEGVERALFTNDTGNWGTQSYLVRHGSIQSRILPALRFMNSEIDVQLNNSTDRLNIYFFKPSILRLNQTFAVNSTIDTQ